MKNKGPVVTAAGSVISLVLGILYAWSVIKVAIEDSVKAGTGFNWDLSSLNDPYSLAVLAFAFTMIVSGKIQDKIGPKVTSYVGIILITGGILLTASSDSYTAWLLGYGLMSGAGIGFAYAAVTPAAVKWFPDNKTGLITGIVVSGFGLASVYIAPMYTYLIGRYGISYTMVIFSVLFFVVSSIATLFLQNPSDEYMKNLKAGNEGPVKKTAAADAEPGKMLKSSKFYILWFTYFIGAGAGLMVISFISEMAKKGLGSSSFLAVAILAIGNAGGRLMAGWLSDKIGRTKTLLILFTFQAILMFVSIPVTGSSSPGIFILLFLATFIGFNYGSNLSLFPSLAKDYWGIKNFGINYGILFTSWGLGGFVLSRVSQMVKASTGSLQYSFLIAGSLLVIAVIVLFLLHQKEKKANV